MDAIKQLREKAAAKQDAAIMNAKREYKLTLKKIAELQSRISGTRKPRATERAGVKLIDVVYSVLSGDQSFTLDRSNDSNTPRPVSLPCSR